MKQSEFKLPDGKAPFKYEVFGVCADCGNPKGTIKISTKLSPTETTPEKIICDQCLSNNLPS